MAQRRELKIEIIGDEKDAVRGIGRTNRELDKLGRAAGRANGAVVKMSGSMGSRFAGLSAVAGRTGRAIGSGLAIGTAAFGALGAAGAVLGIKTAAGMEQARISFETMLGSASKADVFLRKLADFAAKTPFEFPELQSAASSLISAGIQADKVIPIMRTLGDVTSGMGTGSEGVKRATIALQQMAAAGRITGEDLNQLRDAGIPVFDLLAAATGRTKAEVVKLAQAGKLGAKELGQLMKALETGKGLERFSGLMEKQSRSLTGLWSTFKDTLGMRLAKLLDPAIPALKRGLGQVTKLTDGAFNAITAFAEGASTGSERGLGGFFTTVSRVGAEVGNMVRVLIGGSDAIAGEASSGFTRFADALRRGVLAVVPKVIEVAKKLVAAVKDWLPALKEAGKVVGGAVVVAFRAVAEVLPGVVDTFGKLGRFVSEHIGLAKTLAGVIGTLVVVTKAHAAALKIQAALTAAGGLAEWIKQTRIVSSLTKTWTAVQWALNIAMSANPIGLVILAVAGLAAGLVIAWKKSETFRNVVTGVFGAVARASGDAVAFMIRGFRGFLVGVLTVFDGFVSAAAKAFGWLPNGIGDSLKAANAAFDKFKNDTLATLDAMATAAGAVGEATGRRLKEGFYKVVGPNGLTTTVTVLPSGRIRESGQTLPGMAAGGTVTRAGLALVGENGPEILSMRRGASVVPLPRTNPIPQVIFAAGSIVVQGSVITERQLGTFLRDVLLKAQSKGGAAPVLAR